MKSFFFALCFQITLCSAVLAYDPPEVSAGAAEYDKVTCEQTYADNCINTVCVTGNSEESHSAECTQTCTAEAADKCANKQD